MAEWRGGILADFVAPIERLVARAGRPYGKTLRDLPRRIPALTEEVSMAPSSTSVMPRIDLSTDRGDVPLPFPVEGAEEEPPRGNKLVRGLRSILPIIGELAKGAATQAPDFLTALGSEYSRSQQEPIQDMLAGQQFRKGEADILETLAQAGERGAKARREEVGAELDPIEVEANRLAKEAEAFYKTQLGESEALLRRYRPALESAAIKEKASDLAAAATEEEMNRYELENLLPAEADEARNRAKQLAASAGYLGAREKSEPGRAKAQRDYARGMLLNENKFVASQQGRRVDRIWQLIEDNRKEEKTLLSKAEVDIKAQDSALEGGEEKIESVKDIRESYQEELDEIRARRKGLMDRLSSLERPSGGSRSGSSPIPGMTDPLDPFGIE